MNAKPVPTITLVVTVIFGIISMAMAISAYAKWASAADQYGSILGNWKTAPIINATVVSSASNCPSGYEHLNVGVIREQTVSCVGDNETTPFYCDAPAPARSGESLFFDTATYYLGNWKGSKVCVQRGGSNAIDRPLESMDGYKNCGDNPETGPFYFESTLPCPVTYLGQSAPSSGTYETYAFGTSGSFYVQRDSTLGRPFLQFKTGEGTPCLTNNDDNNGVRTSSGEIAGLNATGSAFTVSTAGGTLRNPYRTQHPVLGSCDTDNRFVSIGTNTEQALLTENLRTNNGEIPLYEYIFASDSSSTSWTFWNRPEILWKADCPYSREEVNNVENIIAVLTACTLALMIISIFAALFDCAMEGWSWKLAHDGDDSNDGVGSWYQKFGNFCCTLGNTVTTIVTMVFVVRGEYFFKAMRDANCSDGQTNDVIGYLAKTAISLLDLWIAKLVFDGLKLIYYIYSIYKGWDTKGASV